MKNKNIIILVVIILIVLIGTAAYNFINTRTYELNLPQVENLKTISSKQNENIKVISDNDEMKNVLNNIYGVKRTTKKESIQDAPENVENTIKIDFNFIEGGSSTLFVYKKNNKYYVEQPYNGKYEILEEEYNSINQTLENAKELIQEPLENLEMIFYNKLPKEKKQLNIILDNSETDKYNYNIYAVEGQVNIIVDGEEIPLRNALLENKVTMEEILDKAHKDYPNAISYDDGGTDEYHYDKYTIIKINQLGARKDVYIGNKDLTLNKLVERDDYPTRDTIHIYSENTDI